ISLRAVMPFSIMLTVIGSAVSFASVYWQMILQKNTPREMTGRIFSISSFIGNTSMPLAYTLFGALLSIVPKGAVQMFCGFGLVGMALLFRKRFLENCGR
ncbi:MAG: MFS transporter, partial [Clostridia bacterium]|nr:MFS transporter [Clostridia bacterium]